MSAVQPPRKTERQRLLADGAVRVLADQGARGLTHRRLDRELGLPEGSTSNAFPTRGALFTAVLDSLADPALAAFDQASARLPETLTPQDAAALFADTVFGWLVPSERHNLIARFELILESTRQTALRERLAALRAAFVDVAARLAAAAGASDPGEAATMLVSLADGILIAHLSPQAKPPDRTQTMLAALEVLERPERRRPG